VKSVTVLLISALLEPDD